MPSGRRQMVISPRFSTSDVMVALERPVVSWPLTRRMASPSRSPAAQASLSTSTRLTTGRAPSFASWRPSSSNSRPIDKRICTCGSSSPTGSSRSTLIINGRTLSRGSSSSRHLPEVRVLAISTMRSAGLRPQRSAWPLALTPATLGWSALHSTSHPRRAVPSGKKAWRRTAAVCSCGAAAGPRRISGPARQPTPDPMVPLNRGSAGLTDLDLRWISTSDSSPAAPDCASPPPSRLASVTSSWPSEASFSRNLCSSAPQPPDGCLFCATSRMMGTSSRSSFSTARSAEH
mmetsp:Transcript_67710/g.179986  ORF Transcript_67710/g.179986 Transcript_67710/m.179986 type:complete len:289 (-) Transcript_67710:445-1311(-)